jgi:large conductance mechanosensitive channel
MWQEFKKFALKGNVIDLAVGVVIGAAFSKIVSSLVDNILMPIVGLLLGGFDFTNLQYTYDDATIKYGQFIQNVVDFFIIAFSIFLFVKLLQKFRRKQEVQTEVTAPTNEEKILSEIRDILKEQQQQKGV